MLYKEAIFIIGIFILEPVRSDDSTISPTESTVPMFTTPKPYHFMPIYSLQYNISKEKSLELILKLLMDDTFNTVIKPNDILNLVDSKNLIVPTKLLDINFEELIDIANISMNEFLRSLIAYVPENKISNIISILDKFSIDFNEYIQYFIVDNDESMLELMKSGNYTEETIRSALIVMNKTEEQMVSILKPIFLNELVKLPLDVILYHFDEEIKDLFFGTNITLDDITKYESFNEMFQNFIKITNNETFWATAISNNTLVTVSAAFLTVQEFNQFLLVHVENIENNSIHNQGSIRLNNSFSIIAVNESLESYIMIDYDAKDSRECYYLSQSSPGGNLSVHELKNITFKANIIFGMLERGNVLHNFGSPLICEDRLYGILISHNETNLQFLRFSSDNASSEKPTSPGTHLEHHENGGGRRFYINLVLIIVSIITYVHIYFV